MARRKRNRNKNKAGEQQTLPGTEAGAEAAPERTDAETPQPRVINAQAAKAYAEQQAADLAAAPAEEPVTAAAPDENGMVPLSQLVELQKQAQDYLNMAKRSQADLENYRKRVQKEAAGRKREMLGGFLKDFLPVFNDLDRVLAEGEKSQDFASFHEAVALMRGNLWKAMERAGVTEVEALEKPFDPNVHEALTMVPAPGAAPNSVIEVFEPGYQLEDYLLRPAKVVVAAPSGE